MAKKGKKKKGKKKSKEELETERIAKELEEKLAAEEEAKKLAEEQKRKEEEQRRKAEEAAVLRKIELDRLDGEADVDSAADAVHAAAVQKMFQQIEEKEQWERYRSTNGGDEGGLSLPPCELPLCPASWAMNASTIIMPCDYSDSCVTLSFTLIHLWSRMDQW